MNPNEKVQAAIDHVISERGEIGVQVAAYKDGKLVVDAWGGYADREKGRKVERDTLFNIWSVTKGVVATALHIQTERGLVDYDAPVAKYWPEFAAHGKVRGTVRHALTHRIGVPSIPPETTPELMCDWDWMAAKLADSKPVYEPGTRDAYHSYTWGRIIGEIVRRTDPKCRPFGAFVREEICQPLGIDDLWIGLPEREIPRVAHTYDLPGGAPANPNNPHKIAAVPDAVKVVSRIWERPEVRMACIPGEGGICTARAEARVWALLAGRGQLDGVRLLSESRVRSFTEPRPPLDQDDDVIAGRTNIGVGGYRVRGPDHPEMGNSPTMLYCPGSGGSIGWADVDKGVAAAICHNRMLPFKFPVDATLDPVVNAIQEALR